MFRIWPITRSFIVLSNASKDFLCAIVHSSHTINFHCCKVFAIAEFFEMLQVGVSLLSIFYGDFSAEWAVRPPSNNMAAIPDEANVIAISSCEQIVAKINEIKKIFLVPHLKSKPLQFHHLEFS